MVNALVVAPIPTASVMTITAAIPGVCRHVRDAIRKSVRRAIGGAS
jgi:hypothetical protein